MLDYKAMYLHLFREMTKAIDTMVKAQRATEEMFLQMEDTIVRLSERVHILEDENSK